MYNPIRNKFSARYKCFSSAVPLSGDNIRDFERGGKIILPPSALDQLSRMDVQYPMMFRLENKKTGRVSHTGVLEFVSEEGRAYLPPWIMKNLNLLEGSVVICENASLPVATYVKFEPQTVDFLDVQDPKGSLEAGLRSFSCVSTGDLVSLHLEGKTFEIKILETKPADAVSIVECDMSVDFAPPVGYVEPQRKTKEEQLREEAEWKPYKVALDRYHASKFQIFGGEGNKLDAGVKKPEESSDQVEKMESEKRETEKGKKKEEMKRERGVPNYEYKKGRLVFMRSLEFLKEEKMEEEKKEEEKGKTAFKAFSGVGQSMRD